jgi:uracil-DNA glycosylase family 4
VLTKERSCIVNGAGINDAKIAFVGEGPGQWEDKKRRPFIGKAGRVLKVIEWLAGIDQYKVFHTNATRCFGGRNPTGAEVDNCHDYLIEELKELNPTVIVALGGAALRSLYRRGVTVGSVMGFTLYNEELPGIPIIPTYHPSYIMRKHWDEMALVLAHFRKAKRIADAGGIVEKMGSYMGITTLEDLRSLRDYLLGPTVESISVDTETTGLSWLDDELLCVSLSGEVGTGFSVPILHRGERTVIKMKGRGKTRKEVPEQEWYPVPYWDLDTEMPEAIAILDEILRSDKPKEGQNISFDLRMLERSPDEVAVTAQTAFGFYVNNVRDDSRLLSSLLSEVSPANLTVLAAYWTDIPYYEQEISQFKSKMWHLPDEKLWVYGGADVDVVKTVVPILLPKVRDEGAEWVYRNISIPLIRCATKLEERGVYIDREYFDNLCRYYKDRLQSSQDTLDAEMGRHIESPTYYQTVQNLVFKELDLPLTNWVTKGALKECKQCKRDAPCSPGHASTSADALSELNERVDHPVLPLLIDIRHIEKFYGTYLEGGAGGGFRSHIRTDGRIHARWNAARAATGRFSCENPNLMNPPKEVKIDSDEYNIHSEDAIRSMFIAPLGYGVLNADWSQAEVWVMAYETGDERLLGLLRSGQDIHAYVARELCKLGISSRFPKECVDETLSLEDWKVKYKPIRDRGKVFVFGMNYGLTEEGAGQRLGCSKEEASPLLGHYTTHIFPTMGAYFIRIREEMFKYGVSRDIFGRGRHFVEVPALAALRYKGDLEGAIRQGYNMPVQGGAHDLHSLAHIATEKELSSFVAPILEMHDSLLMEAPLDRLEEAGAAVKELWVRVAHDTILPSGKRLDWDIPVDVQWGHSFGDLTLQESKE